VRRQQMMATKLSIRHSLLAIRCRNVGGASATNHRIGVSRERKIRPHIGLMEKRRSEETGKGEVNKNDLSVNVRC